MRSKKRKGGREIERNGERKKNGGKEIETKWVSL